MENIIAIEMQSLESGLQYLDRLPKEQDGGRQASQRVKGVERAQRHLIVHFGVREAVVGGAVEGAAAVGGVEHGEGGDGEGEEGEEEDVDEEEGPDEAVLDLQERLGERVLEQVLVFPLDYLVVQGHLAVRQARLPLERLKVEYDQQAGRREVLGDEYIALILTFIMV